MIPKTGRLVQCNNCNNKWFFKNETNAQLKPFDSINSIEQKNPIIIEKPETIELLDNQNNNDFTLEKNSPVDSSKNDTNLKEISSQNKKNYRILGFTIIFLITFISLLIILDTFQNPISKFFPNIEFILYNLYESIKDIILFFTDLI